MLRNDYSFEPHTIWGNFISVCKTSSILTTEEKNIMRPRKKCRWIYNRKVEAENQQTHSSLLGSKKRPRENAVTRLKNLSLNSQGRLMSISDRPGPRFGAPKPGAPPFYGDGAPSGAPPDLFSQPRPRPRPRPFFREIRGYCVAHFHSQFPLKRSTEDTYFP